MELIREPLNVDFVVDPRPLTKEEEQAVSEFIKADKEKRKQKKQGKVRTVKRKPKQLV